MRKHKFDLFRRLFNSAFPQNLETQLVKQPKLGLQQLEDRSTPATFTVTTTADTGAGSLRQAITDSLVAGADNIVFDASFSAAQTITLASALPVITSAGGALTITGPGSNLLTIQGGSGFRAFESAISLTMSGLTINGFTNVTTSDGAAIRFTGANPNKLDLDNVIISNNSTGGTATDGGGIAFSTTGALHLKNSTVTGNTSGRGGGGIYFVNGGSFLIENSTISNNTSNGTVSGGGIYFFGTATAAPPSPLTASTLVIRNSALTGNVALGGGGGVGLKSFTGTLSVVNSTIANNQATGTSSGGGIFQSASGGSISVVNSTITGNSSAATAANTGGGGIARTSTTAGSVTVQNSVVSGNTNANGPDILSSTATTTNVNFSAVGSNTGFTLSGTSGNNLGFGAALDLGTLGTANGGTTAYFEPNAASPLIGAGSNALIPSGITTDQRGAGFLRTFGGTVDIGSVERQPVGPPVAAGTGPLVNTAGATSYTFTVTYSDPNGSNNGVLTAGIIGNDSAVRVTGPGAFDVPATYVSIDNAANGTPRTATYTITPPGGAWDVADFGTYSINVQANQVFDNDANPVPAGTVGTFSVDITNFIVFNTNDSGFGSLRQAILTSNSIAGTDTITFDPTAFSTAQTIAIASALPAITDSVIIAGPGENLISPASGDNLVTVQGVAGSRVFDSTAANLTMTGFTITGGSSTADGGGLQASGIITLDGMVMTGNTVTGNDGGAIRVNSGGTLIVRNSTISGNTARNGGAVYFFSGGNLLVENSTISGNTSTATVDSYGGGGIYFFGTAGTLPGGGFPASTLVIRNSTIAGNTTSASGGGVQLENFTGTLLVQNSTIVGNTSTLTTTGQGGGGIAKTSGAGTITVDNSIVAGNTNANGPDILSANTVNLNFSGVDSTTGFTVTGANNVTSGVSATLGALTYNNGGFTQTIAPNTGSPVLNSGSNLLIPAGVTSDQRGFGYTRTFGGTVDMGALEDQPVGFPVASANTTPVTAANESQTSYTFTVTFADPTGANRGIDVSTIINNNAAIRVTGPNGYDQLATYVSINNATNGITRTATYSIVPPGGDWDAIDTGLYTVSIEAGQVEDIDNNVIGAGAIGTINVFIPNYTVFNANDTGFGSFRQVITDAATSTSNDTITFDPAFFSTPRTISLQTALPALSAASGDLNIDGPGSSNLTIERPTGATTEFRILISYAPNLEISGVTMTGGLVTNQNGGGIFTASNVVLDDVRLTNNTINTAGAGGGIFINGNRFLTVRNSTISGNTAASNGGGIYFFSGGSLLMENTTISGNTTLDGTDNQGGGGIYFYGTVATAGLPSGFVPGSLVIRNSTIANNTSAGSGGAILGDPLNGEILIENSTIVGNTATNNNAGQGGGGIGILTGTGTINAVNSIIANNTNGNGPDILSVNTVELNYSAYSSTTGFTLTGANNVDGGATPLQLGVLASNGGLVQTILPLTGSPLIDAGDNASIPLGITADSRGLPYVRIYDGTVDIGAAESQPPKVTINQAVGQADPTAVATITFTAVFDTDVTGLTDADIILTGTAGGTLAASVTEIDPRTYTITVTGMTSSGTVIAEIPAGAAEDQFATANEASTSTDNEVTFDITAPTVTIEQGSTQADPTNIPTIVFDVVFDEDVTGFDATDINFTGTTAGGTPVAAVTQLTPSTYTVTVTGVSGLGDVVANITAGTYLDVAGNLGEASTSTDNVVLFDTVGPTVTINSAAGQTDPTSNNPVLFDVVFNEAPSGFTAADIDFTGSTNPGALSAVIVPVTATTFTVQVSGAAHNDVIVASIPAAAVTDSLGNVSTAATFTDNVVTTDYLAPTVTLEQQGTQADPTNVEPILFDLVFSEPVSGLTGSDFVFTGTATGSVATVTMVTPTTYTLSVSGMTSTGTVVPTLPAGSYTDVAGNLGGASTSTDNSVNFEYGGTLEFSSPTYSINENGSGTITVTVNRTGGTVGAVAVTYATSNGTATAGAAADYLSSTGTLNWADGDATPQTFTITVNDDRLLEANETIILTLSNPVNAAAISRVGSPATATIVDIEEGQFNFSLSRFNVAETAGTATITVNRTNGSFGAVSIDYTTLLSGKAHTGGGSAGGQNDFNPTSGVLNWADGDSAPKTFTIAINDDAFNEGKENIPLLLSNPTGNTIIGTTGSANAMILQSDGSNLASFVDDDNDAGKITLTGGGTWLYYLDDPDGNSKGDLDVVEVNGTVATKSALTVTALKTKTTVAGPDAGKIALGGVEGTTLKSITARASDLNSDGILLSGYLGTVIVADILNGADIISGGTPLPTQLTSITANVIGNDTTITTGTRLNTFSAISTGTGGSINAPSIGTLTIRGRKTPISAFDAGNFGSTVNLTGLGLAANALSLTTMSVAGSILPGANITAPSIGGVTVLGNSAGNFTVSGAGIVPLPTRNVFRALTVTGSLTGDINVTGPMATIAARDYLTGSVSVSNITSITTRGKTTVPTNAGDLGASITVTGAGLNVLPLGKVALGTLSVAGSLLATADLNIASATTITVKKNLLGDITTTAVGLLPGKTVIGTITAGESIIGSNILVNGPVTTINAMDFLTGSVNVASIGSINIKGKTTVPTNAGDLGAPITVTGTGLAAGKVALGTLSVAGSILATADITTPSATTITAKKNILGDITASGAGIAPGKVVVGTIKSLESINSAVNVGGLITTLAAAAIPGGSVNASRIATLSVTGDVKKSIVGNLGADITLTGTGVPSGTTTLTTGTVAGSVLAGADIIAPSIGTMTVKGNYLGDITLSGAGILPTKNVLTRLAVTGSINGSDILVSGNVGAVTAQNIIDTRLFAGFSGANNGIGVFAGAGTIASVTTTGLSNSYQNSHIIGSKIGTILFKSINATNGGTKFGVISDTTITSLKSTTPPTFTYVPTGPAVQFFGADFEVRIV